MLPNWSPLPPLRETTLTGRTVRVEALSAERHGKDLFESFAADVNGRSWTYRFEEAAASYLEFCEWLNQLEEGGKHFGVYVDQAATKAAGMGALMHADYKHGTIELGSIMLSPAMSQTTSATEAFYLQIGWAFGLGFRRVSWTCDPLNAASVKAAQRLGFSFEAIFRQAYVSKGRNRDKAIFSIVDSDWPAVQGAIQQWLAPQNFDDLGQQRSSLSTLTALLVLAWMPSSAAASKHTNSFGQPIGPAVQWAPVAAPSRGLRLQGRSLQLQPLRACHARELHDAYSDAPAEHWAWLPYGPFESADKYAEWVETSSRSEDPFFFAIMVEDAPAGVAAYLNIVPEHGSIEVGHLSFAPRLQKTLAATEAMFLTMKWAFEQGYRRYEWKCNARNGPSRRAAQRFGLSFEGLLRHHNVVRGENRDTAYFAATDQEWPRLKSAFEAWLDPTNFDASGVNVQSLSALTAL